MDCLSTAADVSAIATAIVATVAYFGFLVSKSARKGRLERYLKSQKGEAKDRGQRSVLHLMAKLKMTEAEILSASFGSNRIRAKVRADPDTGTASVLFFEFE